MTLYRTEGIILQSIPFQDNHRIVSAFTYDSGLIKLFIKGKQLQKREIAPLTEAEFVYKIGKSDIFPCQEIALIQLHLRLRENLNRLYVACELLKIIQTSQPLGKPAPLLYCLLKQYLKQLPKASDPNIFASSFRLKILKHEGLYFLHNQCADCGEVLKEYYIFKGQSYCSFHCSPNALMLIDNDIDFLNYLASCRSSSQLALFSISTHLMLSIHRLFDEAFSI